MTTTSVGPPSPWVSMVGSPGSDLRVDGKVLDLACGAGRHARYFLERGHPVVCVDKDVGGLADLVGTKGVTIIQHDLETFSEGSWPPEIEGQQFGVVVVTNYLYRALFPTIVGSVAPLGLLIYETFARGNAQYGKPSNPNFLLLPNELLTITTPALTVLKYSHGYLPAYEGRECVKQMVVARRDDGADRASSLLGSRPAL